jgi:tRNA-dihydrouridine synthase 2
VAGDVAGIDLNCGCPKKFSVHDGSGAGLLETPDTLISILKAIMEAVTIPVTCKIRLVPASAEGTATENTIKLLKKIEMTGVKAIAIHCRFASEKPREPGHWDVFDELATSVSVPVIANGDLWSLDHIDQLKSSHGTAISSFMFARAAMWNVSMFRKEGPLPVRQVMDEYLKLAIEMDMPYNNMKYTLMQFRMECGDKERIQFHKDIIACKTVEKISALFNLTSFYESTISALERRRKELGNDLDCLPPQKRLKK